MPRPGLIAVTFLVASPAARASTLAALEAEQEALFDRVAPGVVVVSAGGLVSAGFAVAPGLVLTAAHAVAGAREVTVTLRDGRAARATVAEVAPDGLDVALLRIALSPPPLPIAAGAALRAGSVVAAIGHPDGSRWTLATGLVAQDPADGKDPSLLRLQLPLRAGASGGPVVDRSGRVVAIVVSGEAQTSVAFAVRIGAALRSVGAPVPRPSAEPADGRAGGARASLDGSTPASP